MPSAVSVMFPLSSNPNPNPRVREGLELIPAGSGREVGNTLSQRQYHHLICELWSIKRQTSEVIL